MLNWRMRNIFFVLFLILAHNFAFSQRGERVEKAAKPSPQSLRAGVFIDVNASGYPETNYTIEQLIKNVLVAGGSCNANVISNVVVSPNLAATIPNRSWGYFNKGGTSFPFATGVALSTGFVRKAGNVFEADLSDALNTGGDQDLANAIGVANAQLKDATYIEFDLVPVTNTISFRYIFASKEYDPSYQFACDKTDGFALLLKKASDPPSSYTNLAVLPNGGGPVSVTNVRPAYSSCAAQNVQYFAGINTPQIETNFSGRTIPLTASATVTPGETYHLKIVLADYQDRSYDSGVFLEAGSLNLGVKIQDGSGNTLPSTINICGNISQTLVASSNFTGANYQWFLGTNPIPGATSASYTATQSGTYTVKVTIPGYPCPEEATVTIVGGVPPVVQNATLTGCYVAGNITFNLTLAESAITSNPGATFAYYLNQADANAGNANTIPTPTAYPSAGGTIYVLVRNGSCSTIAQLQLVKAPQMTVTIAPPISLTCTNPQTTLDATSSVYPPGATFSWTTTGGNIVSGGNTLTPTINAPGTYTLTILNTYQPGNTTCTAIGSVTVSGDTAPPTTGLTATKVKICAGESVTLTASGGATYNWQNGLTGNGATQVVTPTANTTYTVTAVSAGGCVSQNPASITIEVFQPITVQNATLLKCYEPGNMVYDLTSAESQITTASGVTFDYYLVQADANAGNTNTIPNPTAYSSAGNQTIYVLVKNGGCSYVVTLQLLKTAETTLNIAAPQSITCTNSQVTLNASTSIIPSGSTITWTTTGGNIVSGANTLNPIVNAGGTYTLTVTNVNQPGNLNCTYTKSITVIEDKTLPVAGVTSSHQQICVGESVTLTATGGATYNWQNGLTGNGNTQVVSPSTTTTYSVYAVGANGCVSTTPATVTVVVGPPTAMVAASKTKICAGESVTLTASGGITYNWVGLTGNGNTQIVSPTVTTIYSVYALGGNGCSSVKAAEVTIEVVAAITSTLEDVYVCSGDSGTLDAGAGTNYTYVWNTGATTQTITTNVTGTYSVTISNGVCSRVFTAQLLNPELPQFTNVVYEKNVLTLTASNPTGGILEYSINGGVTWQTSNIFNNVLNNTNYDLMVRVKDAKCSTSLQYYTLVISNVITPNQDGKNDVIDFSGISNYKNFAASIFTRYGQEIFKATSNNSIWKGDVREDNQRVSTATYWYQVQWENPASKKLEIRTGWILLKNRN
ncbi:gliding motility protein [Chryseobacterium nematophagum]|uniref:Gliding motility protein n=2 Tax=Chryseobacterium nematophagum TaxID=2305228 RepID=A0A3M7LAW6_9FLAO|nr:gliding motility protein [Chryseobacterium nematophagum]